MNRTIELTELQLEILHRLKDGMKQEAIAAELYTSQSSVNREVRQMYEEHGVPNTAALIYKLTKEGVI